MNSWRPICKYASRPGGCTSGDCQFFHPPPGAESRRGRKRGKRYEAAPRNQRRFNLTFRHDESCSNGNCEQARKRMEDEFNRCQAFNEELQSKQNELLREIERLKNEVQWYKDELMERCMHTENEVCILESHIESKSNMIKENEKDIQRLKDLCKEQYDDFQEITLKLKDASKKISTTGSEETEVKTDDKQTEIEHESFKIVPCFGGKISLKIPVPGAENTGGISEKQKENIESKNCTKEIKTLSSKSLKNKILEIINKIQSQVVERAKNIDETYEEKSRLLEGELKEKNKIIEEQKSIQMSNELRNEELVEDIKTQTFLYEILEKTLENLKNSYEQKLDKEEVDHGKKVSQLHGEMLKNQENLRKVYQQLQLRDEMINKLKLRRAKE